jgi:hypothetical protein
MELVLLTQINDKRPPGQLFAYLQGSQTHQSPKRIRYQVGRGSGETSLLRRHAGNVHVGSGDLLVERWEVSQSLPRDT